MEKVGGLFNKEVQETGNVVISQEDFNAFQKQIEAAQMIKEDYEYIKSDKALNDLKSENSKLKKEHNELSELVIKVNDTVKERNKQIDNAYKFMKVIKEMFEKLEQIIGRNKYKNLMNDVSRDNGHMIHVVRMLDKQIHPEEHQEQEQKHEKKNNRGMSR